MDTENTQDFIRPQRWLDMLKLIATEKGWNRPNLARRYGCSVRAIAEDIALLNQFEEIEIKYKQGGYCLMKGQIPFSHLSRQQLIALFIGTKLLTRSIDEEQTQDALRQISADLQEEDRELLWELSDRIYVAPGGRFCSAETLFQIYKAVSERRTLKVKYQSFTMETTDMFQLEPYGIYLGPNGEAYVIGRRPGNAGKPYSHFKLRRFLSIKDESEPGSFEYPEHFSIREEMTKGFWSEGELQEAVLRFVPSVAQLVREREPAERIEEQKDGSLIVRKPIRHPKELLWEVLRDEANVEVLEPQELRELVKRRIEQMRQVYKQGLDLNRKWQDE